MVGRAQHRGSEGPEALGGSAEGGSEAPRPLSLQLLPPAQRGPARGPLGLRGERACVYTCVCLGARGVAGCFCEDGKKQDACEEPGRSTVL